MEGFFNTHKDEPKPQLPEVKGLGITPGNPFAPFVIGTLVISLAAHSLLFSLIFVMTNGGPNDATTTIVHQIFQNAFSYMKMGYASALAWMMSVCAPRPVNTRPSSLRTRIVTSPWAS